MFLSVQDKFFDGLGHTVVVVVGGGDVIGHSLDGILGILHGNAHPGIGDRVMGREGRRVLFGCDDPASPQFIVTRRGMGYILKA